MLRTMKEMEGSIIRATDGDMGHVRDFYFDDEAWLFRYLVVENGRMAISPQSAVIADND